MRNVLGTPIAEFSDNLQSCIAKVKPLSFLQPPLEIQSLQMQDVEDLCKLCPANLLPDSRSLFAEMESFCGNCFDKTTGKPENIAGAAAEVFHQRRVFPLTNRAYGLALTSPISVAKNERTFSRLKIVKNFLRARTKDERLNSLMLLYCERDILDAIDIQHIALKWARQKKRRIFVD